MGSGGELEGGKTNVSQSSKNLKPAVFSDMDLTIVCPV